MNRRGGRSINFSVEKPKPREIVAWLLAAGALILHHKSIGAPKSSQALFMNDKPESYYEKKRLTATNSVAYYEPAIIHPRSGLVSRKWHSNSAPTINPDFRKGSCWCSADEYCMCTPSLAIDVILTSGEEHIWVVKRHDTGQLACMGGFTEVGEIPEETVRRELKEEMNIDLETIPTLFGVYGDPLRDARRHTVSIVYIARVPADSHPKPGDDAKQVLKIHMNDVDKFDFFADHLTIIYDYREMRLTHSDHIQSRGDNTFIGDDSPKNKRSKCPA